MCVCVRACVCVIGTNQGVHYTWIGSISTFQRLSYYGSE